MDNDLISRSELKKCAIPCQIHNGALTDLCVPLYQIDNAQAVEPFEPDYVGAERLKARQRGYEAGYHYGMEMGKTLNPKIKQGVWIKVKEDRMSIDMSGQLVTQYKCSKCGRMIATLPSKLVDYPFCHCGAKMENNAESL